MSVTVHSIPSKSFAHRALICAGAARRRCNVICQPESEDVRTTRECVEALEAGEKEMNVRQSGSTLRFMLPMTAAAGKSVRFLIKGRLMKRPMKPLLTQLRAHGCTVEVEEGYIDLKGRLTSGQFVLPGNVSSQFISGLLMALPLVKGDSRIEILGDLESEAYVEITLEVMSQMGIRWVSKHSELGRAFLIPGGQRYLPPREYRVEGDWSAAAFWLAMGAIGQRPVSVKGLNMNSVQGDRIILRILEDFGAQVVVEGDMVSVLPSQLKGRKVDVRQIPDLAPVVALLGTAASGTTTISEGKRLRLKESDRLKSMGILIQQLGGKAREKDDSLVIKGMGKKMLKGGTVDTFSDHRIVMMAAALSIISKDKVEIRDKKAVEKSYPEFFRTLEEAGLADNLI